MALQVPTGNDLSGMGWILLTVLAVLPIAPIAAFEIGVGIDLGTTFSGELLLSQSVCCGTLSRYADGVCSRLLTEISSATSLALLATERFSLDSLGASPHVIQERVEDDYGTELTPSVVSFDRNGDESVGDSAETMLLLDPEQVVVGGKRLLGRPFAEIPQDELDKLLFTTVSCPPERGTYENFTVSPHACVARSTQCATASTVTVSVGVFVLDPCRQPRQGWTLV